MKKFTKKELLGLSAIFLILLVISIPNFLASFKRARDNTRKADLGSMVYGLEEYQKDLLTFPLATSDGKVIACMKEGEKVEIDAKGRLKANLIPCEWGKDPLYDPRDEDKSDPYLLLIPTDPQNSVNGSKYLYFSNGKRYQVYAALESEDDDQYDESIVKRNLKCGERICNTGRSYSNTPLDKSIEEYEDELLKQSLGL